MMTREEIHKLPWEAQEYINSLERKLALFSVSCCAFVDEIAPMAEYIKGHHYKDEYRKLMIPVVEYNELKEAAKKFDEKHCS